MFAHEADILYAQFFGMNCQPILLSQLPVLLMRFSTQTIATHVATEMTDAEDGLLSQFNLRSHFFLNVSQLPGVLLQCSFRVVLVGKDHGVDVAIRITILGVWATGRHFTLSHSLVRAR